MGRPNSQPKRRPKLRRTRQPKIRYPGVRARWSNILGWTFRASNSFAGHRRVGLARTTQEEASDDYRRCRDGGAALPVQAYTLGEAVDRVIRDAHDRGVPARTLMLAYRGHARYLERFWRDDTRMKDIGRSKILWFIRSARMADRSPNTLIQKDLPLLSRCFAVSGLPDPIPDIRYELRQTLKFVPPQMSYFEAHEIREILRRMRTSTFVRVRTDCRSCRQECAFVLEEGRRPGSRACPHCQRRQKISPSRSGEVVAFAARAREADLVELLALTGVRAGELGRIRLCDIDTRRQRIGVISKDRGHPRYLEIIQALRPIVLRLARAARLRAGEDAPDDEVLLVPNGMGTINNLCRRWKERLGEPRLNGRTLRHSFVTGLLYAGAGAAEAKALAGHRSLSTTDRYIHEISRTRVAVLDAWSRRLAGEETAAESDSPPHRPEPPDRPA